MTTEIQKDILELEAALSTAERQTVKNILSAEIEKLRNSFNLQKKLAEQETPKQVVGSNAPVTNDLIFDPINGYSWDQEGSFVKVYVSLNDVGALPKENVSCAFDESSFNLAVQGLNRKNLRLYLQKLGGDILVDESKIIIKKNMVIIKMKKQDDDEWTDLLEKKAPSGDDAKQGGMPGMGGMGGGMPGMGGMGGMPGMGGEGEGESEGADGKDPQAGLMDMMKKMYDEGDDDMKRTINEAMAKAQAGKGKEGGPPA